MKNKTDVAKTILSCLGGEKQLKKSIGAYDFSGASIGGPTGEGLSFSWTASSKNGANRVSIRALPDGSYKVLFYFLKDGDVSLIDGGHRLGIRGHRLVDLFEAETGLPLTLKTP